jgi:sec-independent protein translocase protein TatB
MFDVGFGELFMVGLVALLVIGPERLPKVARTAGLWIGRARRMIAGVKADIDRELKAEELREILDKQARSNPLEEIIQEGKGALDDLRRTVDTPSRSTAATPPAAAPVPPPDKKPAD